MNADPSFYIALSLLWIAYFAIHSILSTQVVKKKLLFLDKYYRLVFNLFSILGLFVIILFMSIGPITFLWKTGMFNRFAGLVLATYGIFIIKAALKSYDLKLFFGLRQIKEGKEGISPLKTDGILQYVRHPLYAGSIVLLLGYLLFSPTLTNLISVVLVIAYFFVGSIWEEQKLVEMYGQEYLDYKKRVPALIPRFPLKRNNG